MPSALAALEAPSLVPQEPVLAPFPIPIGVNLPRAALTELVGGISSGRTSLLLSMLQVVTEQGEFCALVDVRNTFDPESGAAAGIELSRLLWVRCGGNVEHALKAADLLVRAGGFGMVVLDVSGAPASVMRRIPIASWFRLRHGAEHSGAALIVTGEHIQAGSCAKLQLTIYPKEILWSAKLLRGIRSIAQFSKRRGEANVCFDSRSR